LDRIKVTVHYNIWDVYRMEMAERWRRCHSADSPVISSAFSIAIVLYVLLQLVFDIIFSTAWRRMVPSLAVWLLVLWAAWWAVAPFLEARRQAEAAVSETPVRFIFSPEGVEIVRFEVSMHIAWPGIRRVKETRFSFLIYPRQGSPYATAPDGRLIQVLPWMKLHFTFPVTGSRAPRICAFSASSSASTSPPR